MHSKFIFFNQRTLTLALLFLIYLLPLNLPAQDKDTYDFFPKDITYDPDFPTPASILGYNVGEWHVSHDQLVYYMKEMARLSDRITIAETGRTHENRPLLLLTITSPENQAKIEDIKAQHVALSDPASSASIDITNMPVVVWLGHSVHGNEASGATASILTVYHWAAARGPKIDDILSKTVILVDPTINPDGYQRFTTWVNSNRGKNINPDPNDREHNEMWPGGRTNHYWFDLNRDWLPQQQPESRARMAKYHEWKPNVLTDHHEMGTNSSFFFTPGIPTRNNPLIPEGTIRLTEKIAAYHAQELDKIGSYYYSQESFDNFYIGKGSTYPDFNGAIGFLFEQASTRGHIQSSVNGDISFPFAIRNQFTAGWSTVLGAYNLRLELLEHQRSFYKGSLKAASADPVKAYIWNAGKDYSKAQHFIDLLKRNQVEVYKVGASQRVAGKTYNPEDSYIVPLNQPNYRLAKVIFDKTTTFQDSLFYDVSAWTLPLAMNLNYAPISGKALPKNVLGEKIAGPDWSKGSVERSDYAYAMRWDDYYAPKVLYNVLKNGLKAKVATLPFSSGGENYDRGTILIPVSQQDLTADEIYQVLTEAIAGTSIKIEAINSGYTTGVNLGSNSFRPLRDPKVAILTDGGTTGWNGVRSYDAGEAWHLLDYRMDMTVTLLPISRFNNADLHKYNTIIMVDGNYSSLNGDKLKNWIQQGGLVVAAKRAGKWLANNKITSIEYKAKEKPDKQNNRPYGDEQKYRGAQVIGGAIFNTKGDLTHPVLYGIENNNIPIFRQGQLYMQPAKGQYANPLIYTNQPLLAGYISPANQKELGGTAAIAVSALGSGKVITFADNPNFRAFWFGTNKLFLNAVFFGSTIRGSSTR